jgi:hypothetical protein
LDGTTVSDSPAAAEQPAHGSHTVDRIDRIDRMDRKDRLGPSRVRARSRLEHEKGSLCHAPDSLWLRLPPAPRLYEVLRMGVVVVDDDDVSTALCLLYLLGL